MEIVEKPGRIVDDHVEAHGIAGANATVEMLVTTYAGGMVVCSIRVEMNA